MSLLELYDRGAIYDAMPEDEYVGYFHAVAVPAFYEVMTELVDVGDQEMRPLVTVLNLLGIRTFSCCCGHGRTMAFVCIHVKTIRDYDYVHRVLTDTCDGQLEEFSRIIGKTYQVSTLQRGLRIDLDYTPVESTLFGVWLWYQAITATKLRLG
jgi:hypothetical protein